MCRQVVLKDHFVVLIRQRVSLVGVREYILKCFFLYRPSKSNLNRRSSHRARQLAPSANLEIYTLEILSMIKFGNNSLRDWRKGYLRPVKSYSLFCVWLYRRLTAINE